MPNGLLLIKLNAMNPQFWRDLKDCFETADQDSDVRAVVLTGGESRIFTAGLDLAESFASAPKDGDENGAKIDWPDLSIGRQQVSYLNNHNKTSMDMFYCACVCVCACVVCVCA